MFYMPRSIDRYFEEDMKINCGTESTSRSLLDNFILSEDETREIRSVVLIISNNKRYVVSFPKASFNIVLAIARTKALYMLARGMARGRVALQFLVMRLRCIYVNARTDIVCAYTVASNSDDIVPYLRIRGAVLRGLH